MGYVGNQTTTAFTSMAKQDITGDGGTGYTLDHAVANAQEIEVFVNNVRQEPGTAYTVSGTTLTMTGNVASTDDFYVVFQGKAIQTSVPGDNTVTTAMLQDDAVTAAKININGNELFLDADADTSITADTDDQIDFKTAGTDRMHIDSSGNVGIGITPTEPLHIDSGSATTRIKLENDGTAAAGGNGLNLSIDNSLNATLSNAKAGILTFGTSNAERIRIDSSGNVGIGATDPANSNTYLAFRRTTYARTQIVTGHNNTGNRTMVSFFGNGSQAGSINVSPTATQYNTSSDHRLKENVADMTGAIARVKQLAPKRFNFIADTTDTLVDGFLAHEAQTVVPEAVYGTHNEVDDDGNAVMQGIDLSKLVPLLTGALQEAIAKIETLETKVAALENA